MTPRVAFIAFSVAFALAVTFAAITTTKHISGTRAAISLRTI
jgi:hypothetical protein